MSLRTRFVFTTAALLSVALLVGCGSSGTKATPPPTGSFTNSDLNGTYVFSTSGVDIAGDPIEFAGVFVANGSGGIATTGGVLDVVDPGFDPSVSSGLAITGGSYNVGVDGRPASSGGLLTLATSAGTFTFDFVIASDQNGQITYYSQNGSYGGTGSGTYTLQSTVSQSNIDGQAYAFNVLGLTSSEGPFAVAGAFTLDANGQVGVTTSGVEDVNNGSESVCGLAGCSLTSSGVGTSINLATTPGTATFTSSAGTFTFDVYPVDATNLVLIETDGAFFGTGNAFTQSSLPSGSTNNIFSMAAADYSNDGEPLTAVGLLATDGNGNITNASSEDFNDVGTYNEVTGYTGTYTALTTGRSVVTLTGFVKGDGGLGCSGCEFAAYPSTGGMILLEIDDGGFADGSAFAQTSTTFASGAGYGMDLTGLNDASGEGAVEEDDIVEFTNTSGALAGIIDFNDEGATTFDQSYSASYAADTTIPGRGTVSIPTSGTVNSYDMVTYVVDSSLSLGIVADNFMIASGTLQTQASTSSSKAAARHMMIPRLPHMKAAKARQNQPKK